jgi:hypothetical protein
MKILNIYAIFRTYARTIICCLMFGFLCTNNLFAQEKKPLELNEITQYLKKAVPESTLIKDVKTLRVNFELNSANTAKLARAGASDNLLEVIGNNFAKNVNQTYKGELKITNPHEGFECGTQLRVEGKSQIYPGRYLWLFVHRSDLPGWWPQNSAIKIKPDGSWMQGAYIGVPADVGFDFEIKAIWINDAAHNEMVQYIKDGTSTSSYPPISLPDGEPTTMITVKKVK